MAFGSFPLGDGALGGDGSPSNAYTLAAEPGTFAVTGAPVALVVGRKLIAEPGNFDVTGGPAMLLVAHRLAAEPGVFSITGGAASLEYGWRLAAGIGSFVISGGDAHLSVALHRPTSILRPKAATFQRGRKAISSSGDDSLVTWDAYLSGAPVDIQPRSGSQRQREYGRSVESTHTMYADASMAAGLLVGDRIVENSVVYLVTFIAVEGRHIEADLARVAVL